MVGNDPGAGVTGVTGVVVMELCWHSWHSRQASARVHDGAQTQQSQGPLIPSPHLLTALMRLTSTADATRSRQYRWAALLPKQTVRPAGRGVESRGRSKSASRHQWGNPHRRATVVVLIRPSMPGPGWDSRRTCVQAAYHEQGLLQGAWLTVIVTPTTIVIIVVIIIHPLTVTMGSAFKWTLCVIGPAACNGGRHTYATR